MTNAFDSTEYPEVEPNVLVVGDRWLWKRSNLTTYDNALFTLSYQALHQTIANARFTITATASGNDYLIEVASTTTTGYKAGAYSWTSFITRDSDSERIRLGKGVFLIHVDFGTAYADPRTYAQTQVDLLQDKLQKLNQRQMSSYSAGARSAVLVDIAATRRELLYWQRVRSGELNVLRVKKGKRSAHTIQARF